MKALPLVISALAAALTGGPPAGAAAMAVAYRREDSIGAAARTPEEFVIARNSTLSGGMLAHSSHSSHSSHRSHSSHSSHYSGGSPTGPSAPSTLAPAYTPAPLGTIPPETPRPYTAPTLIPRPAATTRAGAAGTWRQLTVVHVEELSPFHYNIELSDGHTYSFVNKIISWTPGDAVQLHAEQSRASRRWYYTLVGPDGTRLEARRSR
jgi:hypothetical protein